MIQGFSVKILPAAHPVAAHAHPSGTGAVLVLVLMVLVFLVVHLRVS